MTLFLFFNLSKKFFFNKNIISLIHTKMGLTPSSLTASDNFKSELSFNYDSHVKYFLGIFKKLKK